MNQTLVEEPSTMVRPERSASSPKETPAPSEQLAIYGGPKTARRFRDRWRNTRLRDLLPGLKYVARDQNTLTSGGPIGSFESQFARQTDTRYAIFMNSGTATLYSAFVAAGIRPGDEVLVPTYTWFASATPIMQCGGTPVFCDIDARTLTMDPDDAERRITPRTKAICVVHVWGNPAAMDQFVDIAKRHNLILIEDASHAHGASYQGKPVGSWGDIGCFSLQGTKAVSGGEAGVVVTNNALYYDRMLALGHNLRRADHATDSIEVDEMCLGVKFRPHLFASVMAGASLSRLPRLNSLRKRNLQILEDELEGCSAIEPIHTYDGAERGGYLGFLLRYHSKEAGGWPREAFVQAARAEGVRISIDRYTCFSPEAQTLHRVPLFNTLDLSQFGGGLSAVQFHQLPKEIRLPVAEQVVNELISLPPYTLVSEKVVRTQARGMRKVAEAACRIKDLRVGLVS